MQTVDVEIGKRLRALRKLKGWTQGELADRVGVTYQQIQKYENGSNRIAASRLHVIASIFGVGIDLFFYGLEEGDKLMVPFQEFADMVLRLGDRAKRTRLQELLQDN